MIVLGFHTAGPACELAIVRDSEILHEESAAMLRGQDARLPGLTQELLANAGLTLDAIDRFAVTTGPGSFTGIRVGVAFARGLALVTGKPCLGITTLEAALPAGQQGSAIVVLPAQKRPPDITYWAQTFRSGAATDDACETSLQALTDRLTSHPHMVYGDAAALIAEMPELTVHAAAPSAARAAQLASALDPETRTARPTYARAPDAALPKARTET